MEEFEIEGNPFEEEFDSEDVINRDELQSSISKKDLDKQRRTDPEFNTKGYTQKDIDQLVNYDQERRKQLAFKSKMSDEIDLDVDENTQLENEFKDFLVYPRISGNSKLRGDKTLIPSSNVVKSDKIVEIVDAPKTKSKHSPATILVNRDEVGDIDNIEIVCTCGDRILLKFEKSDHLDAENTKLETEVLSGPLPFDDDDVKEESNVKSKKEKSKVEEINEDDDFFTSEKKGEKESLKENKVEEEEFFEEDFGVDDSELDLGGIDLSGI